jgi:hypothetical protein
VSWTGTGANGEGVIGSMEMTTEFVREPLAQHVSISGDYPQIEGMRIPQNQRLDLYYIDGAVYTNLLGRWQTRPADEDALIAFTRLPLVALDELVKGIGQATYRRNEFRNGVDTLRFDLDKMSFQVADSQGAVIEDGGGEVYVATEGNYPVSLDVVLSGVNLDIPADTREGILSNGTVEVAFDISSINEAFQVQVPEAALDAEPLPAASPEPLLLADIPVPDDALDLTNSPLGLRTFRSPRAWEVLALFYRDRMPKQGWRETQVEQAGEVTSLTYTKDSRTSTITIVPDSDSGGTAVWIAIRSE